MIWFDFDNSPHVQIFKPVLNRLNALGYGYKITARDYAQTLDLLRMYNLDFNEVGRYGGKNVLSKILNLQFRSRDLVKFIKGEKITKAVNHGSRTQVIAAKKLGIKSIVMMDYEYTENRIFNYFSDYILLPDVIPDRRLMDTEFNMKKVIRYNGLKEEIYLDEFKPVENFRETINVGSGDLLAVIRPPSMTSNYHDSASEKILIKIIDKLLQYGNSTVLVIPRTKTDRDFIRHKVKLSDNLRFLNKPVDGLQLLHAADITISGGGTMNRESALLGTKTFSIFSGRKPYVDEYLESKGLITFLKDEKDVEQIDLDLKQRSKSNYKTKNLVDQITDMIINLN